MPSNLQEKFAALTQREKIIVIATAFVGLWAGWDNLFYQPIHNKKNTLQQELINLKQQISDQQLIAGKLENTHFIDPNKPNREKLAELKAEYKHQQALIMQSGKNFALPHLMATALSDILRQNTHLTLMKLDTLPVSTLLESKKPHLNPIYKHGLVITFTGNYLDTLNYLIALESLPWRFIWESIDYQVKAYPLAETTIKVYTLSFEENWLGI